ncbi:MAG: 30S ribosomal protein S6 [Bowdeniella nasicola]|nr:30S ribosomal protein S6 [Bowdeniella nasicola]
MRNYELMIILDPEVDERSVQTRLDKFLEIVTKDGGSAETDIWGKRRLAYEINKRSEGIYAVVTMTTLPEHAKELERVLGLSEAVLRTKLIRPDAR